MHAAVVTSFGSPPHHQEYPAPVATDERGAVIDVLAAGLHPRVRSQADGSHYTSTGRLPFVPGVDGVGRDAHGLLRYFVVPETAVLGSMAEQTLVDLRGSVVLPPDSDPVAIAAAMNPAMSSWVALRQRVRFQAGQSVLILGATGSTGQMAVQVAKLLGADRIVAAGRDPVRLSGLAALGATDTVSLAGDPATVARQVGEASGDIDFVIDYVWGEPAASAMVALVTGRADRARPLTWIEVGSVAGATAAIPSAVLRAARLQIVGSGQGSVSASEYLAELPALATAITSGTLRIRARPVPLADVERAWTESAESEQRIVLVPGP
jgi:NADPH:quinone reductase-like Zn-dependent oxidoreductase